MFLFLQCSYLNCQLGRSYSRTNHVQYMLSKNHINNRQSGGNFQENSEIQEGNQTRLFNHPKYQLASQLCSCTKTHFILFRLSTLCEPIYYVLLKHGLTLSMNPMAEVVRVGLVFIWLFNHGPMAFLRKKPQSLSLLTEPENQSKFRCYTCPQKSHKLYMQSCGKLQG